MNRSLFEEANFRLRADALEALEHRDDPALRAELEEVDRRLFAKLRDAIRGGLRGAALLARIRGYVPVSTASLYYDHLDTFMAELLLTQPLPEPTLPPDPEMVFYQRTPSRVVFDLAAQLTTTDVFYDIGSGLGEVAIVVNLLTGARAKGIEIEPGYCAYASAIAADLNVDVQFINDDARTADIADATVFFLYRPFRGRMLEEVLARLRAQGGRIVTYDLEALR